MTAFSDDLTGGLGTIITTISPAADPTYLAMQDTHGRLFGAVPRLANPLSGTPDDTFGDRLRGGPRPAGMSTGRGGALGAALPNSGSLSGSMTAIGVMR